MVEGVFSTVFWILCVISTVSFTFFCCTCFGGSKKKRNSNNSKNNQVSNSSSPTTEEALKQPLSSSMPNNSYATINLGDKQFSEAVVKGICEISIQSWPIFDALVSVAAPNDAETLSSSLLVISGARASEIVTHALVRETELCRIQTDLFRGNACAARLFGLLSRKIGSIYLESSLNQAVMDSVQQQQQQQQQQIESNCNLLIKRAKMVLNGLEIHSDLLDYGIIQAVNEAGNGALKKFGDENTRMQVISTLFFLRYVCPAIVTPSICGIRIFTSDGSGSTASLRALARIIQCMANGTSIPPGQIGFEGENFKDLDDFVRHNHLNTRDLLSKIISKRLAMANNSLPAAFISTPEENHLASSNLINYILNKLPVFESNYQNVASELRLKFEENTKGKSK